MNAAQLIKESRQRASLSLRELGGLASTSHSTLSAYESGSKVPSVATLDRILKAAGFRVDVSLQQRQRGNPALSRGEELCAVLELAEQFPARHKRRLSYPVFPQISASR